MGAQGGMSRQTGRQTGRQTDSVKIVCLISKISVRIPHVGPVPGLCVWKQRQGAVPVAVAL